MLGVEGFSVKFLNLHCCATPFALPAAPPGNQSAMPHLPLARTGLRLDGRRAEEVRHTTFSRVLVPGADGAVFLQQGGTHVLASVWGPREVPRSVR